MKSRKISEIDIEVSDWDESVYLTFDFDWASDFILVDLLDLLERYDLSATFFVTHDTPVLERIRANPKYELGIHPNFNDILDAGIDEIKENSKSRIQDIKRIVPEALSMRSHSTTNSSRLMDIASKEGIIYDCNYFIPYQSGIVLEPWLLWNEIIRCPYFYEDDASMIYNLQELSLSFLLKKKGLKIFNFHPIHVYINSSSMNDYESTRDIHFSEQELANKRGEAWGVRDKLIELLDSICRVQ
jgi:hypothetical protein